MSNKSLHVRIIGKVQGVCFRAWTRDVANELGLSGWVKNCADGSVEALFSGEQAIVDQMLDLCRSGPPSASVDHIEILTRDLEPDQGFRIIT